MAWRGEGLWGEGRWEGLVPGGVFPFKQKDSWEDEAGNHRCLVFFLFFGVGGGWRDIERLLLYVYVVLVFLVPFFQDFCDSRSGLGVSNVNRFAGHHKPTPPFCLGRWWVTSSWISSQGMASSLIRWLYPWLQLLWATVAKNAYQLASIFPTCPAVRVVDLLCYASLRWRHSFMSSWLSGEEMWTTWLRCSGVDWYFYRIVKVHLIT